MTQARTYQHTPIALIGGGLTTQVLALSLVHSGFDFIWFSGPQDSQIETKDTRTTTIHHAGKMMLDALGIWTGLQEYACPITQIAVAGTEQAMACSVPATAICVIGQAYSCRPVQMPNASSIILPAWWMVVVRVSLVSIWLSCGPENQMKSKPECTRLSARTCVVNPPPIRAIGVCWYVRACVILL